MGDLNDNTQFEQVECWHPATCWYVADIDRMIAERNAKWARLRRMRAAYGRRRR